MGTAIDERTLRRFLLGDCSPAEAEEIGVRLIDEPEYEDRVLAAEDELIEDFLDDLLTATDREMFLSNFMTTPSRLEKLEQTSLLMNFARRQSAPAEVVPDVDKRGFAESFAVWFGGRGRLVLTCAALLVVVFGAVWLLTGRGESLSPLEQEFASVNAKDLANSPEMTGLTTKSLAPGVFRGTESGAKLKLAELTERVLLRLAVAGSGTESVDVDIARGGNPVFRLRRLRVYRNPNGAEIKVVIPRSILSTGNFEVRVSDGSVYGFAVE